MNFKFQKFMSCKTSSQMIMHANCIKLLIIDKILRTIMDTVYNYKIVLHNLPENTIIMHYAISSCTSITDLMHREQL